MRLRLTSLRTDSCHPRAAVPGLRPALGSLGRRLGARLCTGTDRQGCVHALLGAAPRRTPVARSGRGTAPGQGPVPLFLAADRDTWVSLAPPCRSAADLRGRRGCRHGRGNWAVRPDDSLEIFPATELFRRHPTLTSTPVNRCGIGRRRHWAAADDTRTRSRARPQLTAADGQLWPCGQSVTEPVFRTADEARCSSQTAHQLSPPLSLTRTLQRASRVHGEPHAQRRIRDRVPAACSSGLQQTGPSTSSTT